MNRENAQFYYFALIHLSALLLALVGCSTQSKSIGLGGSLGVGTGTVLGGIADPGKNGEFRTRNIVVGAALGGMAGMITGSLVHEQTEKQKQDAFRKGRATAPQGRGQGAVPDLTDPRVESHWIEGRVSGNRYIEGHFEHVIVEPVRWEQKR